VVDSEFDSAKEALMTQVNDETPVNAEQQDETADTQGYLKAVYDDGSGDKSRPGAGSLDDPISGGLLPYQIQGPTLSDGRIVGNTTYPY
jgi:hypothetical protein